MKKIITLILLLPFMSFAQFNNIKNSTQENFTVSGDAILRIQPNQVVLYLGVESRGKELFKTKEKNYSILSKAINYCKEMKIQPYIYINICSRT